jgi:hypothetical protein
LLGGVFWAYRLDHQDSITLLEHCSKLAPQLRREKSDELGSEIQDWPKVFTTHFGGATGT